MAEQHHKESPSHYNAWVHCIHWQGTDKQTDEANAGSYNHAELQKGIEDVEYEPDTYVARWANEWVHCESGDTCTLVSEKPLVGTLPDLKDITGTTDVYWMDSQGCKHFADLKTFSDGTEDYSWQLKGYVALDVEANTSWIPDKKVYLHILHGGICKVETIETTVVDCVSDTITLLSKVRKGNSDPVINKYCQYCSKIKECPMANNAVQIVQGGGSVDFSKMSLPQKLVVCETVKKLIKSIENEAKEEARKNNGVLEADGIRYEFKTKNGKGRVRDLCEVATHLSNGVLVNNKSGDGTIIKGISQEELLSLCELPNTAFVDAMKKANEDRKDVPKKNIEAWCASLYDKGEPVVYLARVK